MTWNCTISSFWPAPLRRPAAAWLGLVMAVTLGACAGNTNGSDDMGESAIPPGAIQVSAELYMLPMGTDEGGCAVFQPWSPTLMVVQALHWRTAEGEFTLDREKADCPDPAPTSGRS